MRTTWLASSTAAVFAAALAFAGCGGSGGGGGGAPPPTGTGTGTTTTQQVGSRYWYENDTFGNPFKTHDAQEATLAAEVFNLVNQERAAAGLPALQYDLQAERAAKVHCEDMDARQYFSHTTPEGWSPSDRLSMTGASGFSSWAENIALGQTTAQQVMSSWMNSAGHRANILGNTTHIGVGVAVSGGGGGTHWCQVFLRR